jgi:hypothetical protein
MDDRRITPMASMTALPLKLEIILALLMFFYFREVAVWAFEIGY